MRDVAPDVATNRLFVGRLVVVVIDDLAMGRDYWTTATASRVAQTILDELGPDDLTAVVYTGSNDKAQNFTADRSRILEALSDIKRVVPRFGAVSAPSCKSTWGSTVLVLDELLRVTTALQSEPERRKTILFAARPSTAPISSLERLRRKRTTARAALGEHQHLRDRSAGSAGWRMDIASRRGPSLAPPVLRWADWTGWTDCAGCGEHGRQAIITQKTIPEAGIPRSSKRIVPTTWSIFTGHSSLDGRFRKLEVKVNRDGVEVRTRNGYFAGAPITRKSSQKKGPPVSPLDESVTGLPPLTATPLRLSAAPFRISGKQEAVVAMVLGVRQPLADAAAAQPMLSVVAHADLRSQAVHRGHSISRVEERRRIRGALRPAGAWPLRAESRD